MKYATFRYDTVEVENGLYMNFNFDFLAFEKVYFENNFATQIRGSFVL